MQSTIINIKSTIGDTLHIRDEAAILFDYIKQKYANDLHLTFDFEGVYFMSRSFADEFHKIKTKTTQDSGLCIDITNAELQIAKILQAVSFTQVSGSRSINKNRTILSFTSSEQLSDYLMSI